MQRSIRQEHRRLLLILYFQCKRRRQLRRERCGPYFGHGHGLQSSSWKFWLEINYYNHAIPETYFRRQLRMKRKTLDKLLDLVRDVPAHIPKVRLIKHCYNDDRLSLLKKTLLTRFCFDSEVFRILSCLERDHRLFWSFAVWEKCYDNFRNTGRTYFHANFDSYNQM